MEYLKKIGIEDNFLIDSKEINFSEILGEGSFG